MDTRHEPMESEESQDAGTNGISETAPRRKGGGDTRVGRTHKGRWVTVAVALLVVTGGFVIAQSPFDNSRGAASPERAEEPIRLLAVETVIATLDGSYEVEDRFVGRAEAARESDLGFELAGTVVSVFVEEGDTVEAGQKLAVLDTDRLQARRNELTALLEQMEAGLALADSTLERLQSAAKARAVSLQDVDEAAERKLNAEAGVNRIRSQRNAIDVDLRKSVLMAPYSGAIAKRASDEGAIVSPGQMVLRLLEIDRIEIRTGFTAEAAASISVGDGFGVQTTSGNAVEATVTRILPQRDTRTRTVDVILTLAENGSNVVRPGDLIEVKRARRIDSPGIWLPRTALTESARGLWAGYVLTDAGSGQFKLERRQLEVIDETGDRVFVQGAIQDGEKVVAAGLHRLAPGQRVRESDPGVAPLAKN